MIAGTARPGRRRRRRAPLPTRRQRRSAITSGRDFTYDLNVDPNDDTNAIAKFLETRRGFCVQFASTYAVMARVLGIPSRVAVGFTQGTEVDGVFHVQSHNAHAWPEIWLAGLGWTHLFDPTPPAGSSGTNDVGGSSLPGDPAVVTPITAPGTTVTTVPGPASSTPATGGTGNGPTATTNAPLPPLVSTTAPEGDSQPWLVVLAILVAILAAVLIYVAVVIGAKSRRRARRRDAAEPAAAVQGAWDEALDKLREAHVRPDPALTPLELARSAPRHGVTAATRPLRSLARSYTVVRYGACSDVDGGRRSSVGGGRRPRPRARCRAHAGGNGGGAASTRPRFAPTSGRP